MALQVQILSVQFRSSGPAELGVDTGGTEYFHYLMKDLERRNLNGVQLFEGEPRHLVPRFEYYLVSGNMMKLVGRIDSAFHPEQLQDVDGISPAVVTYVVSATRDTVLEKLDTQDVPD